MGEVKNNKMKIGVVGLGLIGGSIAKDLRTRGFADFIYGVDINKTHAEQALQIGLIDEIVDLDKVIANSDIILLTTPVNTLLTLLPFVLDHIPNNTVVIDIGSTKAEICKTVQHHKNRKHYLAAHPIAGTENKGPLSAINNLFDNKICIFCETQLSSVHAIKWSRELFTCLKMDIIELSADDHDLHLAYVSHLSHVISYALGVTVLEIEKDKTKILELAGSGFASTARLAKSSPEMWVPIYEQNTENVITAVNAYIGKLQEFKKILEEKKFDELHKYILKANEIRKVLEKK
jgi:prephenate dehydrogenase